MGSFSRRQTDDILFFPENRNWHFMQIVSKGGRQFAWNVKSYLLGKLRKIFQDAICWNFLPSMQSVKNNFKSAFLLILLFNV